MKVSITTFEKQLRDRLLDIVFAQWSELGVPFSLEMTADSTHEVIDPEALVWCSLEFLPTEPRLLEATTTWLAANRHSLIRQRLRRVTKSGEPRTNIWSVVGEVKQPALRTPDEPCHGQRTADDVVAFCRELEELRADDHVRRDWLGSPAPRASTILLHTRDLLGGDIRHMLLVYLLANPGGAPLRDIAAWSKYSYRNIAETVSRWATAGVLKTDHGFCRLNKPACWHELLQNRAEQLVLVDWFTVFDAVVRLLRILAKARSKGLSLESTVIASSCRDAERAILSAVQDEDGSPSVRYLLRAAGGRA